MLDCGMHMGFNDDVSARSTSVYKRYRIHPLANICIKQIDFASFNPEAIPGLLLYHAEWATDRILGLRDYQVCGEKLMCAFTFPVFSIVELHCLRYHSFPVISTWTTAVLSPT